MLKKLYLNSLPTTLRPYKMGRHRLGIFRIMKEHSKRSGIRIGPDGLPKKSMFSYSGIVQNEHILSIYFYSLFVSGESKSIGMNGCWGESVTIESLLIQASHCSSNRLKVAEKYRVNS